MDVFATSFTPAFQGQVLRRIHIENSAICRSYHDWRRDISWLSRDFVHEMARDSSIYILNKDSALV